MSYKSDIQATTFSAASSVAVISATVRLRGISVASDGNGQGSVSLTTGSQGGTNLLTVVVPDGDVYTLNIPENGILFPQGVFCSTLTSVASVTLFTDQYNAPGMVGQNG